MLCKDNVVCIDLLIFSNLFQNLLLDEVIKIVVEKFNATKIKIFCCSVVHYLHENHNYVKMIIISETILRWAPKQQPKCKCGRLLEKLVCN